MEHQPQSLGHEQSSTIKNVEVAPTLAEDWEDAMFSSSTPINSYVAKDVCKEMNLGIEETSKIIKIYENFFNTKWKYCYKKCLRKIHKAYELNALIVEVVIRIEFNIECGGSHSY